MNPRTRRLQFMNGWRLGTPGVEIVTGRGVRELVVVVPVARRPVIWLRHPAPPGMRLDELQQHGDTVGRIVGLIAEVGRILSDRRLLEGLGLT